MRGTNWVAGALLLFLGLGFIGYLLAERETLEASLPGGEVGFIAFVLIVTGTVFVGFFGLMTGGSR